MVTDVEDIWRRLESMVVYVVNGGEIFTINKLYSCCTRRPLSFWHS